MNEWDDELAIAFVFKVRQLPAIIKAFKNETQIGADVIQDAVIVKPAVSETVSSALRKINVKGGNEEKVVAYLKEHDGWATNADLKECGVAPNSLGVTLRILTAKDIIRRVGDAKPYRYELFEKEEQEENDE